MDKHRAAFGTRYTLNRFRSMRKQAHKILRNHPAEHGTVYISDTLNHLYVVRSW